MRKTPYQMLMEEAREYMDEVDYPHRVTMWTYPKGDLGKGWDLLRLHERVAAAQQLGYEVIILSSCGDLHVVYQKKRPERPWRFR